MSALSARSARVSQSAAAMKFAAKITASMLMVFSPHLFYGKGAPCQDAQRGGSPLVLTSVPRLAGWERPQYPVAGYFRPSFGWGGVDSIPTNIYWHEGLPVPYRRGPSRSPVAISRTTGSIGPTSTLAVESRRADTEHARRLRQRITAGADGCLDNKAFNLRQGHPDEGLGCYRKFFLCPAAVFKGRRLGA